MRSSRVRRRNPINQSGVSLVELVVSLVAATTLMIGMSLSLGVVIRSADTINEMDRYEDSLVRDWLADDLRHSTRMQSLSANRWVIDRLAEDGSIQEIRYRLNGNGLQRRLGTDPWATIDPRVDGYSIHRNEHWTAAEQNRIAEQVSATNLVASTAAPKVIGVTTAAENDDDDLTIPRPRSAINGDWLFLAASARETNSMNLGGGWSTQTDDTQWGWGTRIRMVVWSRKVDASTPNHFTIDTSSDTTINAVLVAVRGCDPYNPVAAAADQSAWIIDTTNQQPKPRFRDSTEPSELNLQFLGADRETAATPSMNMPGYVDTAHSTSTTSTRRALYAASRQGSLPQTSVTIQTELPRFTVYVLSSLRIRP